MKKILVLLVFIQTYQTQAFVAGPSAAAAGENLISISVQQERGKVEPNENKASFQEAEIDITKVKYVRGFDKLLGFSRSNIYIDSSSFKSAKEQVGATLFYDSDSGSFTNLGFSADIYHDLEKQFGFFVQANLAKKYNEKKFSNPRIDTFALGLTTSFHITENLFSKNLIHFGSGDGSNQNGYLAVDTGFGYKLNQYLGTQATISASLFLEADTAERFDAAYDAAFSAAGRQDRVRAFKYGSLIGADVELIENLSVSVSYLQKLGGYDARSTQILNAGLGLKF